MPDAHQPDPTDDPYAQLRSSVRRPGPALPVTALGDVDGADAQRYEGGLEGAGYAVQQLGDHPYDPATDPDAAAPGAPR